MILDKLINFIKKLNVNQFLGKVELNFYKGNLSGNIKKEITLSENDIDWINAQKDCISPPERKENDE